MLTYLALLGLAGRMLGSVEDETSPDRRSG